MRAVCVCPEIRPNHYKVAFGQLLTALFLDGRQKAIIQSDDLPVEKKASPPHPPFIAFLFPFSSTTSGLKLRSANERRIKRSLFSPPPLLLHIKKISPHREPFVAGFHRPPPIPSLRSQFFSVHGAKARVEAEQKSIYGPSAHHLLVSSVIKQVKSWIGKNRGAGRGAGNYLGKFPDETEGWVSVTPDLLHVRAGWPD